jgi:hypothetical protein
MLTGERPEELVMPVRQCLVAGTAIAGTVQCQRALVDNGPVTGWRPRLDLPGHGLARVKSEGVEIKDTNMRLVTPVSHRGKGVVDLHGAVVTVHRGRGLTVPRRSRHWLRARAGRPGRESHAGGSQRRTGNEGEISTPGNRGHSMPPLVDNVGPYQDKRRGPGNRYTQPQPHTAAPRRPRRLSQGPAGCLRRPAWPDLSGLVLPGNITLSARSAMPGPAPRVCGGHARRLRHRRGMPGVWRLRGQPRRTSRPASRPWPVTPASRGVRQLRPGSARLPTPPPTGTGRRYRRPSRRQRRADRRHSRPAAGRPVPEAARGRGQRGRRRQRGDGAHAALDRKATAKGSSGTP